MKHVLLMTLGITCCLIGFVGLAAGDTTGIGLFLLIVGGAILALRYKKWKAWYGTGTKPAADRGEAAWNRKMPVSSRIIGTSTRANTGSAVGRAMVGDALAGFGGALIGVATAKNTDMTKFLVTYRDGHTGTETVKNNSARFKELIAVLEK